MIPSITTNSLILSTSVNMFSFQCLDTPARLSIIGYFFYNIEMIDWFSCTKF